MMTDQTKKDTESLVDSLRELCEAGLLVVEEVIETVKPSPEDCERARRHFWEFNAKVASGIAAFAERQMRDTKRQASPRRAESIIVEEE